MYRSDCFISSPMNSTVEVVPSPLVSSCATAVLAIMMAVGFWICCRFNKMLSPTDAILDKRVKMETLMRIYVNHTISFKRVLPSFVSLISPAPPTSLRSQKSTRRVQIRGQTTMRRRERERGKITS